MVVEMNYVERGEKGAVPVVLVHGFPFSHRMWVPQIGDFMRKYRVIAPDLRGFGKTPPGGGETLIDSYVDDLVALLDKLGIEKTALCGLSMGGYVALRAVDRHAGRFSSLILADTRSEADTEEGKAKRADAIRAVRADGLGKFAEGFLPKVFSEDNIRRKVPPVARIREIILGNPVDGVCAALEAMAKRHDMTESLAKIAVPTLIVVGKEDALTPVSCARSMQERIKDSELAVVPRAAHMSNVENPNEFNAVVVKFLSRVYG